MELHTIFDWFYSREVVKFKLKVVGGPKNILYQSYKTEYVKVLTFILLLSVPLFLVANSNSNKSCHSTVGHSLSKILWHHLHCVTKTLQNKKFRLCFRLRMHFSNILKTRLFVRNLRISKIVRVQPFIEKIPGAHISIL